MVSKTKLSLIGCAVSTLFTVNANAVDIVKLTGEGNSINNYAYGNSIHPVQFDQGIDFKVVKSVKMGKNKIKYRMQQYYNDVPVFGYSVASDTPNTKKYSSFLGLAVNNLNQDPSATKPTITSEQALQRSLPQGVKLTDKSISNAQAKLFIYIDKNKEATSCLFDELLSRRQRSSPFKRPYHFIDANTSEILKSWHGLTTDKVGTGPGGNIKTGEYFYGQDYGKIDITEKGDVCSDNSAHVETINLHHFSGGVYNPATFLCSDGNFYNPGKEYNGAYSVVNDAQFFGNVIFDMYNDWFGIPPLTMKLVMRVHYLLHYENAQWDGRDMTFGDGKDTFYPFVALDLTAHEVSHGFTEQNSNLVYFGQSGGMNEAFSDMAGEAAEYYKNNGENDFLVGAEIIKNPDPKVALRYFADPTKDGISIGNAKDYYEGLDVHYSSGVYNKAFYTLATTQDWNTKKAFTVFVKANQIYWNSNSNFC